VRWFFIYLLIILKFECSGGFPILITAGSVYLIKSESNLLVPGTYLEKNSE
jgi:hypothetical protein